MREWMEMRFREKNFSAARCLVWESHSVAHMLRVGYNVAQRAISDLRMYLENDKKASFTQDR